MRYFFFTYRANYDQKYCHANFWCESELFPSNKELRDIFSKRTGFNVNNIIITGWQEFKSKEDYEQFTGIINELN